MFGAIAVAGFYGTATSDRGKDGRDVADASQQPTGRNLVSVRPRTRITASNGPTTVDGASTVDRYLRALDGGLTLGPAVFAALERQFISVANTFARLRGISDETWREVGVSESVLRRANLQPVALAPGASGPREANARTRCY
jgi:hypothetical protein